jgi:hypothetical protein
MMATPFGLWLLRVCTRCVSAMRHAKNLRTDGRTHRPDSGAKSGFAAIEKSKETEFSGSWTPERSQRWIRFRSGDAAGCSLRLACLYCDRGGGGGGGSSTVAFAATAAAARCRRTEMLARCRRREPAASGKPNAENWQVAITVRRRETGSRGEVRQAPTAAGRRGPGGSIVECGRVVERFV